MASSPATAMAGPVPAPVEASGAAPAAWPSSAVPAGFGEAAGLDVSGVLPGSPWPVLLQCLFDRFGSVFPQCGLMVFPGVVIVSR